MAHIGWRSRVQLVGGRSVVALWWPSVPIMNAADVFEVDRLGKPVDGRSRVFSRRFAPRVNFGVRSWQLVDLEHDVVVLGDEDPVVSSRRVQLLPLRLLIDLLRLRLLRWTSDVRKLLLRLLRRTNEIRLIRTTL